MGKIRIWIQERYGTIINSIAFYPAFIALMFLILSTLVISFDFSETGKHLKSQLHWLSLKDASTARSIISSIVAGVISLAVFSFSMVMIVLNQAASQMSNRVLDKLIGNSFQQIVLGIYIGTIVYALFLLSTIRDIDSGIYIPALSTYLLILITIIDIFLFIYFLHYITQSVKYEVIIARIFKETSASLEKSCELKGNQTAHSKTSTTYIIASKKSGIYERFDPQVLLRLCSENDCVVTIMHTPGTFVLKGLPVMSVSKQLSEDVQDHLLEQLYFPTSESIGGNFFYGLRQLTEVAVKALSPGINDPGTAIVSLRALFQLYAYRACYYPETVLFDKNNKERIIITEPGFEIIFSSTILPIWDYGKNDRMIQQEMRHLLTQLQATSGHAVINKLLQDVNR
ncbi:MAG: DUF2254 domain-containing protein [Ferruginibacter sp.]